MSPLAPVLYVNPFSRIGGAERSLLDLMTRLRRHRPVLVCPEEGPLATAARERAVTVRLLPFPPGFERLGRFTRLSDLPAALGALMRLPATCTALARIAVDEGAVLVHANGAKAHALTGRAFAKAPPLVWHWRDLPRPGLRRFLLRFLSKPVALHVANSDAVARGLEGFPAPCRRIYNPIDVERFRPGLLPAEDPFPPDAEVLGLFSILAPPKGLEDMVALFCRLAPKRPRLHLLVVGDEIYRTHGHAGFRRLLENRLRAAGLEGRSHFTGFRDDVERWMNRASLCLHLPRNPESFGRVVAEAMACGRPVLAHDQGGLAEIVRHEKDGLLVPPGDLDAAERAVHRLLDDGALAARLGAAARESVIERFSPARHVQAMEALYDELLGNSAPGD